MMSPMFVPKSIRVNRFGKKVKSENSLVESLNYIAKVIKRVVSSEKYIMNPCVLSLDVSTDACKTKLERAFSCASPDNKVVKITSLVNKSTSKVFRGKKGSTKTFKRVCIRFESPFDISLIANTDLYKETGIIDNIDDNVDHKLPIDDNVENPTHNSEDVNEKETDE